MNYKQRAKWERSRAAGMWRFVLSYAVLFCGAVVAATSVFDYFFSYNGFRLEDLYVKVPIFSVSGLIFGLGIWMVGEYKYQKYSDSARRRS